MTTEPLRALWVTNMFHQEGDAGIRGIFVTQAWNALLATRRVELDRIDVAQGRGAFDYLAANFRVRERWTAGRFDLVHVHYGLTGLSTLTLSKRIPIVFSFYGSDINSTPLRAIARATARGARRRIFVSKRLADRWPSSDNHILPNGVDFDVCVPRPREDACAALAIDPQPRRVLFGGYPENSTKGYATFRDALERVRERFPDAEQLVLSEKAQPYSRVVTKLNAADVLLFTSQRGTEGSPTVVKEALAVGLPVVSVDVGDVPEMLDGVSPGAMVEWPGDDSAASRLRWIDRLAGEVCRVLDGRLRSDGREKREFLRLEKVAEQTIALYEEVVPPPRG